MGFFESAEMLDLGASDNGNVFNLTRHLKKRAPNRTYKQPYSEDWGIILGGFVWRTRYHKGDFAWETFSHF
jgi:hypothetical protein